MIIAPLLAAAMTLPAEIPVEVDLDAAGRVVGCAIQDPEMDPPSGARVCMAARRSARFEPGRDEAGNPVPSKTITKIRRRARMATPAELASAEAARAAVPAPAR
jgi:hypothetical protein